MITLRGYQLDIATQLPTSMKNTNIRGLLGNYNDIASDDLISREGQTIDANSNEERIHYDFGETCKLLIISYDCIRSGYVARKKRKKSINQCFIIQ